MKTATETDRQRWERETLEPTLKKSPERAQTFTTISGRPIERLYTSDDLEGIDVARDIAQPGEFPYTRGIHPTGYRGKLWTMRQFAGFGTPEETNERYKTLLRGQRHAGRLTVEPQLPRPVALGAEAVAHRFRPDLARRAVLRNLLEEIAVRVEEKRDARDEVVHVEARLDAPLHVLEAVTERERQLLQRGRARFADVVPAHRNGVPLRDLM